MHIFRWLWHKFEVVMEGVSIIEVWGLGIVAVGVICMGYMILSM